MVKSLEEWSVDSTLKGIILDFDGVIVDTDIAEYEQRRRAQRRPL